MSVLLINLPSPFLFNEKEQPPLGLLYIAAIIEREYEVEVLDLAGDENWESTLDKKLSTLSSNSFVGIGSTTPQFSIAKKIMDKYKNDFHFIAGGPHPSIVPQKYLDIGFKTVVVGEGENAILDVIEKRLTGIIKKPSMNIDDIPLPARHLIDMDSYKQTFLGKRITHMFTTRGCPYHCAFCSNYEGKHNIRFRKVDDIIDEIYELKYVYDYNRIMFMDDTFTIHPKFNEIMDKIKPMGILWRCHFRANLATVEKLTRMYEAGCRHVTFGIESGSQKILDNIHKMTTVEMNTNAIQICKKVGLKTKAFTMIGLPGETMETMEATKQWLLDNQPDDFDLQIFHPYEDSDIYQNTEKYDISFDKNIDYDTSWFKGNAEGIVSTSSLTAKQINMWRKKNYPEIMRKLQPVRI